MLELKLFALNLTGDGWLDPSTVRLAFNVKNGDSTKALRPLSGGWSFFRRSRCLVGGAIVDDIDYYNRVHEMLHILTSEQNRNNDDIEGFGYRWDSATAWGGVDQTKITSGNYLGIAGGSSNTDTFKPLSGFFNQPNSFP